MLQLDIHPMFLVDIPSIRPISGLFQPNISCFIIFQKGCSKYGYLSPSVDTVKYPGSWILIHSLYKSMVSILFKSCSYEFFNTMLSVFIYIYIFMTYIRLTFETQKHIHISYISSYHLSYLPMARFIIEIYWDPIPVPPLETVKLKSFPWVFPVCSICFSIWSMMVHDEFPLFSIVQLVFRSLFSRILSILFFLHGKKTATFSSWRFKRSSSALAHRSLRWCRTNVITYYRRMGRAAWWGLP